MKILSRLGWEIIRFNQLINQFQLTQTFSMIFDVGCVPQNVTGSQGVFFLQ